MKQFTFERMGGGLGTLNRVARDLGIQWEVVNQSYEESWNVYATKILDGLSEWCKDSGIKDFATGFTQIAIQITFLDNKDAILFKLRWHSAQTA